MISQSCSLISVMSAVKVMFLTIPCCEQCSQNLKSKRVFTSPIWAAENVWPTVVDFAKVVIH